MKHTTPQRPPLVIHAPGQPTTILTPLSPNCSRPNLTTQTLLQSYHQFAGLTWPQKFTPNALEPKLLVPNAITLEAIAPKALVIATLTPKAFCIRFSLRPEHKALGELHYSKRKY